MWTQAEVDQVKAAVEALATGVAVQTVTYAGPPSRTVTYHPTDLDKLRKLLGEMQADMNAQNGKSAVSFASFSKGFNR